MQIMRRINVINVFNSRWSPSNTEIFFVVSYLQKVYRQFIRQFLGATMIVTEHRNNRLHSTAPSFPR